MCAIVQPETTVRPASVHCIPSPSINPFGDDSDLHSTMMFFRYDNTQKREKILSGNAYETMWFVCSRKC